MNSFYYTDVNSLLLSISAPTAITVSTAIAVPSTVTVVAVVAPVSATASLSSTVIASSVRTSVMIRHLGRKRNCLVWVLNTKELLYTLKSSFSISFSAS